MTLVIFITSKIAMPKFFPLVLQLYYIFIIKTFQRYDWLFFEI